ncbi:TrmH family RNA methyltransferase [Azospirillum brasilense]|uniref:TrmH family RNA methyltransferase n=1 Tax=Azospirillum brasilense TaxID=192 RepID=UPI000E0BAAB3|nr:RNA methyltransferase [Azospirillum brasilense]
MPAIIPPSIIPIDDPDDPRIAAYRDVKERDLVGREVRFIAEGAVVLRTLLTASRHETLSLLIAEKRIAGLVPMLDSLPTGVPIYSARQEVLDAIAGFPLHRGILGLGRAAPMPEPDALLAALGPRATVLVLCGIGNHDNVGGIFRNAAAFGVDAVLLDSGCCDPLYRKAIRVSVGAALRVPFVRIPGGTDPVALLERHGFAVLSLSPAGAVTLAGLRRPERAALLLGSEGPGLPASVLARTRTVRIPMAPDFDSLNVATTSGIVLHHLAFMAEPESGVG